MNTPTQRSGFCNNCIHFLHNYNLFPSAPASTNRNELFVQQLSTVIYILLSICVLTLPCVYILYCVDKEPLYLQTIGSVRLNQYYQLQSEFPTSLRCKCSKSSIAYKSFVEMEPRFHEICTSYFVKEDWIEILAMNSNANLVDNDFRKTAPQTFQALQMFCAWSKTVVVHQIEQMNANEYSTAEISSPADFRIDIAVKLDRLRLSTKANFQLSLDMIRKTTHINGLFSALKTNYALNNKSVTITPQSYGGCDCSLSPHCTQQASIYAHPYLTQPVNILGFYHGCTIIEGLLRSDLRCLYNHRCLDLLLSGLAFPTKGVHVKFPTPLTWIRSPNNVSVETLVDALMVESWYSTISYANYFEQCNPTCSYEKMENRWKYETIGIIFIVSLIIGSILPVLKLIISIITNLILFCIRRAPNQVAPVMTNIHT
ncbi:unnamed protein product [Adineta ricciae]|uniref:Uncharacterized protein n=1 Tax=Adineta ricciae TaxID=249248 RepID=A0A813SB30_ADIRI|nr:unnamed protein product [Adineta ricciae]